MTNSRALKDADDSEQQTRTRNENDGQNKRPVIQRKVDLPDESSTEPQQRDLDEAGRHQEQ